MKTPPSPPDHPRHLRLYVRQWIGLPFLFLLPILALFGVFDRTTDTAHAALGSLAVDVSYNSHLRYKDDNKLLVTVANTSNNIIDRIRVSCDSTYLSTYEEPLFIPSPVHTYSVDIGPLAPGERQHIRIEGKIKEMWGSTGFITASTGDDRVSVAIHTFVLP